MENFAILVLILSLLMNYLIIRVTNKYSFFMDPLSSKKIQSFHNNLTPRAGGLSIYILSLVTNYFVSETMFLASLAFLPSFIYGTYEDIKGNTPQKVRLFVMSLSCLTSILLTGLTVQSLGFFNIPTYLQIPFTIFSVIGIASAINFIDGLHGLASGVAIISLTFFGFAANLTDNSELSATLFFLSAIMSGFFICNFPKGKIFLGDAGAYYLGYILAISSEAMVFQNAEISPWFPAALLGYPIIETLFTIWRRLRRQKNKGIRFFTPERVHLHSLLYLRILKSNPAASTILLLGFFLNSMLVFKFRSSDTICALIFLGETMVYLYLYNNLVNFKLGKLAKNMKDFVKAARSENKGVILDFSQSGTITDFLFNTPKGAPDSEYRIKSEDKILVKQPDLLE